MNTRRTIYLVAVSVVLLGLAFVASAEDSCTFQEGQTYDPQTLWNCFKSVPVNEDYKKQTIEALQKAIPTYTFLDIASNPPKSPLSTHAVDLLAELERMKTTQYDNEYEFQKDIASTFILLHDPHTTYRMPSPYSEFVFLAPLFLSSHVVDGGEQKLTVPPYSYPPFLKEPIEARIGYNLDDFINATVVEINNEPALSYVIDWAKDNVGIAKDLGTRLNLAVLQFAPRPDSVGPDPVPVINSIFTARDGYWGNMPDVGVDSIEYGLVFPNGTNGRFKFPWTVLSNGDVTVGPFDPAQRVRTHQSTRSVSNSLSFGIDINKEFAQHNSRWQAEPVGSESLRFLDQVSQFASIHSSGVCSSPSDCFESWDSYENVHGYGMTTYPRVAVLQLDTFGPSDSDEFIKQVAEVLDRAAKEGRDQLILDLTKNGGGDICLGTRIIEYIEDHGLNHAYGPSDMVQSDLAAAMAKNFALSPDGVWSPSQYTSDIGTNFTGSEWLIPGVEHTYGGRTRRYSELLHLSDTACSYDMRFPDNYAKNISGVIIVTRGMCGSTCAFVANHGAIFDHYKTVAVGGIQGKPMQFTSFPGGQVFGQDGFQDAFDSYQIRSSHSDIIPPVLPQSSATYRMTVRQTFPTRYSTFPTEYTFMKADEHLDDTLETVLYPEMSWLQVAQMF